MKKTFTFLIVLIITVSQFVITIHGEADTTKNSGDLDISQGWTIPEYVSNIQPDVDKIFLQNLEMNTGTLRGVLVQAINIGDATLTVQKVIPMKKGHAYDLDLIYAQYYTNGGSGYIDFNGEKIIATTDPSDHEYKKTVIPTADMSYKITIYFISTYGGNPYFKLAYKKNGGITDKQAVVNVHDSSLYVGDSWKARDNFDSALDKTGHSIDFSQVTVDSSKVDTTKAGIYDVTYTYDGVTSTAKVTVKNKKTTGISNTNDKASGKQITHKNNENTKISTSKKHLPQTGDANERFLTLIGIVSLVSFGLAARLKRRGIRK